MMKLLCGELMLISLCGCGGQEDDPMTSDIRDEAPAGRLDGRQWRLGGARIQRVVPNYLEVVLVGETRPAPGCEEELSPEAPSISLSVPDQVGVFGDADPAGMAVRFVVSDDMTYLGGGVIEVRDLTEDFVSVGMHVFASQTNEVNGTVRSMICP
jgi:hypothetical protein